MRTHFEAVFAANVKTIAFFLELYYRLMLANIGASGTRIITTLIAALQRHGKTRGVASLCIGNCHSWLPNAGSVPLDAAVRSSAPRSFSTT